MNLHNYQKLLEFANRIDPMEQNFPMKSMFILKELFGFPKTNLAVFAGSEALQPSTFASASEEGYQNNVILLKSTDKKYIGLLSIEQVKYTVSSKKNNLIEEIARIVEKALQIYLRFYQLEVNFAMMQNIIAHLPVAVILCDSNFHILHINQAARSILELFHKKVSLMEAEDMIKNKLLLNFLNIGSNEYSIPVNDTTLQLSVRNHIIHDIGKETYSTCYQITMNAAGKVNEADWKELLKKRELTNREREVCDLLRLGYSIEEIATRLNISVNTMKRHRESIYRKLNISRINQLNILYEDHIRKNKM
jgi:DNA-binding NarL/FixJ family response regulator